MLSDADGVIAGTEPLDASVLEQAGRLRVISRVGVGLDNVDLVAARRLGIAVRNTPDAVTDAAAELTLAGMLGVLRHVSQMDADMRAGKWTRRMGGLLRGKTVGIVGFGRVGRRLAELLAPFRLRLLAHDVLPDRVAAAALDVEIVELRELLVAVDIVTLHLSGPPEECVVAAPELALLRPGAIVVNASRGGYVDESALQAALAEGRLGGAYLDTFEHEPYDGPLRELPNVVLTPHAGSYAREARARMEIEAVENLLEALGQPRQ